MRTVVVVQARMGSTRLPGKVLADIAGRPMIAHVVDRAGQIDGVDEVVVAIPELAQDDPLAGTVSALGVRVIRGSAEDVLDRYLAATIATGADVVMRVTADCPLLSPTVSAAVLAEHARGGADYVSNTLERSYPRGLDTEVISGAVLRTAAREAVDPADREHVTPFIWRRPDRFRLGSVRAPVDRSGLRWTVDVAEDLAFARAVHEALGPGEFDMDDILELLADRPEVGNLNEGIVQKPLT
jgi:spore coat polysaccharide biosynthesis protein SpsF